MARIYPLFSSSKGNASFVGSPHGGVLIDAGVSCKRLMQALGDCGIPESAIRGIFITHDHSDHIKGLRMVTKRLKVPVYAQAQTGLSGTGDGGGGDRRGCGADRL